MAHQRGLSAHELWTDAEAADYLRKPRKTLANWRHLNMGPAYMRIGKRVVYRKADIDAWLDSQLVTPGAE